MKKTTLILLVLTLTVALSVSCGDSGEEVTPPVDATDNSGGGGGKTDTPNETTELSCVKRQADAFDSNQDLFLKDAVRWSCADVEGVNNNNQDDRGQEYCEFFAVITPPPLVEGSQEWPEPVEIGRITSAEHADDGRLVIETTDLKVDFNEDQIFHLEDYGSDVLGQCVFTSWHSDIFAEPPACEDPEDGTCPDVMGLPVNAERFNMKNPTNSNGAAYDLLEKCLQLPEAGDPSDPEDPRHSDFYRGCLLTSQLFGTQWRRSDPAICAAAIRMAECGCGFEDGSDAASSMIPEQFEDEPVTLRGFPLGGWSGLDKLPAGCNYVDIGDGSQTLVTCALTGSDLLAGASDLKRTCIEKYGNDVVVYVPIPDTELSCAPPEGGQYTDTCSDTPWVVTPYGAN